LVRGKGQHLIDEKDWQRRVEGITFSSETRREKKTRSQPNKKKESCGEKEVDLCSIRGGETTISGVREKERMKEGYMNPIEGCSSEGNGVRMKPDTFSVGDSIFVLQAAKGM